MTMSKMFETRYAFWSHRKSKPGDYCLSCSKTLEKTEHMCLIKTRKGAWVKTTERCKDCTYTKANMLLTSDEWDKFRLWWNLIPDPV